MLTPKDTKVPTELDVIFSHLQYTSQEAILMDLCALRFMPTVFHIYSPRGLSKITIKWYVCYICDSIVVFMAIENKNFDEEVLACIYQEASQISYGTDKLLYVSNSTHSRRCLGFNHIGSDFFSYTNIILQHNYCEGVMHFIRPLSILLYRMIEPDGAFKRIWSMFANQSWSQLHWRAMICQPWSGINHSLPYGKKWDCFGAWSPLKHRKKLHEIVD